MDSLTAAIIAFFILAFAMIAGRLHNTIVTPPMVFVAFGYLMSAHVFNIFNLQAEHGVIHTIAELTLIMLLFTDAARINLKTLLKEYQIPMRMLLIGMPLTICLGMVVALVCFDFLSFWEAAVLAAILAPTDAALGEAVVSNERVPKSIRQSINVESGLNDGLALPAVLIFLGLASAAGSGEANHGLNYWLVYSGKQIIFGPIVGIIVGYVGGKMMSLAHKHHWTEHKFEQLAGVGLALLSFCMAEVIGGNGFIAAFCAGLTIGNTSREICNCLYDFAESQGQLLELFTFIIFGNIVLTYHMSHFSWIMFFYAVLSLTVIRMLPVALSLWGAPLFKQSVTFLGWFGPRGIASILFGLIVLEEMAVVHREEIFVVVTLTVLLSVFVHGISAHPLAIRYAQAIDRLSHKKTDKNLEYQQMSQM